MIRNSLFILLIGAGLWACSDVYTISVTSDPVAINSSIPADAEVDSLIAPYRSELSASMDVQIAFAQNDFQKGRPNAPLNNWAADALLSYERMQQGPEIKDYPPIICLLNVGGLRNPLSAGSISLGDIYKLMPFDNEVVWVELPWSSLTDIADYLNASGGEPIAGAILDSDSLLIDGVSEPSETVWVITSDYLMNGGDRMTFFENQIQFKYGSGLLRDVFIESARMQDTLMFNSDERIRL